MEQYLKDAFTPAARKALVGGLVAAGVALLTQYGVDPNLTLNDALQALAAFAVGHLATYLAKNQSS